MHFLAYLLVGSLPIAFAVELSYKENASFQQVDRLMKRAICTIADPNAAGACALCFGAGSIPCSNPLDCYNPTEGDVCCSDGHFCKAGTVCTDQGTCCPVGTALSACGAKSTVGTVAPAAATAAPSSSKAASSLTTPVVVVAPTSSTIKTSTIAPAQFTGGAARNRFAELDVFAALLAVVQFVF